MSDELNEQWKRLLAAGKVRWMPGMRVRSDQAAVPRAHGSTPCDHGLRAIVTSEFRGVWYGVGLYHSDFPDAEGEPMRGEDLPGTLPVFDDPATLGCLLALAREATGDPSLGTARIDGVWIAHWRRQNKNVVSATEAGALLAAIEAA